MEQSEQINELVKALVAAQKELKSPKKDKTAKVKSKRTGVEYTYNYCDLATIIEQAQPILNKHGLAIFQTNNGTADGVTIITTLAHNSGQWVRGYLTMKPDGASPQEIGSAITYGRRYAYSAIIGIATEEDEDGSLASGKPAEHSRRTEKPGGQPSAPAPKKEGDSHVTDLTPKQFGYLCSLGAKLLSTSSHPVQASTVKETLTNLAISRDTGKKLLDKLAGDDPDEEKQAAWNEVVGKALKRKAQAATAAPPTDDRPPIEAYDDIPF